MRQTIFVTGSFTLVLVFALLTGCVANFYVTPDDFINQVAESQHKSSSPTNFWLVSPVASIFFNAKYNANNMQKILCTDKDGNILYLFPDRNTQIEITSKSTEESIKMYFDTVFFENNKLIGLRSRLVPGMTREIALTDIERIEIYSEFPRTEKVSQK